MVPNPAEPEPNPPGGGSRRLTFVAILALFLIGGIVHAVYFPTLERPEQETPLEPEDATDNPIYLMEGVTHKGDLIHATKTCSIKGSMAECPDAIQVYNKIMQTKSVNSFLEPDYSFESLFDRTEMKFQNGTLSYHSKMMSTWSGAENVEDQPGFDFNLSEMSNFAIVVAVNFEPEFDNIQFRCSFDDKLSEKEISQMMMKYLELTNWIRIVLGLRHENYTASSGTSLDGTWFLAEVEMIGELNDGWNFDDVLMNIVEFDNRQNRWCDCLKVVRDREGDGKGVWKCKHIEATKWYGNIRNMFQKLFDETLCDSDERQKMIEAASAVHMENQ